MQTKAKKAFEAALAGIVELNNAFSDAANRCLGGVDMLAAAAGVMPEKKLRLRVVILRDEAGTPLADSSDVELSIRTAADILLRKARIRLLPASGVFCETAHDAAPAAALDVHCDARAWLEDIGEAGSYFRPRLATHAIGTLTGYASPLTAFIVRSVDCKSGCSLGPIADYVTVGLNGLERNEDGRPRTLAHEIGHACGLWHMKDKENLMCPRCTGTRMRWWQRAIVRNSRHVTYL